jgi:molybdopterin/thiamine biosynthesis adenylyltransferase
MGAPLNLAEFYSQTRNESVRYLEENFEAVIVESDNPISYPVTLKVKITVEDYDINLLISLPFNFPDSFPKVILEEQSFNKLYPLPHLSKFKSLCLFDEVVASPNPENPMGILCSTIEKSREILLKGILKQNLNDYAEEFETYWTEDSKGFFLSFVDPSDMPKEVFLIPFKYGNWKERGIFSDQKGPAIRWIQNLGGTYNEDDITRVLYVPLNESMKYPFPKNNKDIYLLLKENQCNLKDYFRFLSNSKRPSKVLFSIHSHNEYAWGVWEHQKPFKKVVTNYKGRKRIQTGLKGFRKNSQNGWLELIKDFPRMEITRYSVEDVRASRLKSRGGDGKVNNLGLRVAIIGCGAVGSHIAQSLFDIGIQELLLIDYDTLSFGNINRHLCGADQVGLLKTESVKSKLRRHYPTSHIHVYNDNVLSLLKLNQNSLNSYDIVITAISNTPTELRLNELHLENIIKKPILHLWVEPYLAGGHAIWIDPNNKTSLKMLFDNGIYKYQILKNGNLYTKKELGCSTSYVPYGVLELKKFIIEVTIFIQQQLNNEKKCSKAFTWLGNLTEQKKNRRLLAPMWVGANDFSTRSINLETSQDSVDTYDV